MSWWKHYSKDRNGTRNDYEWKGASVLFRQRVSLFLSTRGVSRVHGPHSFRGAKPPKGSFFSLSLSRCRSRPVITKKGKPSSRDVNQAEWPLTMARAPIWSRNTEISPSIVAHVTDPDFSIIGVLAKYRYAEGRRSLHIWLAHSDLRSNLLRPPNYQPWSEIVWGIDGSFVIPELGPGICIYIYIYISFDVAQFCKLTITWNLVEVMDDS